MPQARTLAGKGLPAFLRAPWDIPLAGAGVFAFHLWNVPFVAAGEIFKRSNLAFDFDINRFSGLWCASPFPVAENEDYYAVRHPLAVAVRLVCTPMMAAGLDPPLAAASIAALCAGVSAMLAFAIAIELGLTRPMAHLLTLLWALSASSLILGVLPETYNLAFLTLSLQFLLAIRWVAGKQPSVATRASVAITNFGITITNVLLTALAEFVCRWAREPLMRAACGTFKFGAIAAAPALALALLSFQLWPVQNLASPVDALKQVYWSAASAERTSTKQPPGDVAWTFAASAFVAPAPAHYPSGLESNSYLWDFRGRDYGAIGWAATVGWLGLLAFGIVAAARDKERWPVWTIAGLWAAFNIGLHSYWQFRDAVFLYSPHSHIAIFLFVAAGAAWAQKRGRGAASAYGASLCIVTVLVALNNLPIYFDLSRLN
jgi:Family of unknown function (DUF6080)